MTHSSFLENMASLTTQWSFVLYSLRYLEEKSPIPRQCNRFDHWQDNHSLQIPTCREHYVTYFLISLTRWICKKQKWYLCVRVKRLFQDWGSFSWQANHGRTCSFSMLSQWDSGTSADKIQRTGCFCIFFLACFT